jgi:hypothetical protein
MSYEIENYVFKGVPLSEFLECLSKHSAGTMVELADEYNTKTFLLVDDNLMASIQETQSTLNSDSGKNEVCASDR